MLLLVLMVSSMLPSIAKDLRTEDNSLSSTSVGVSKLKECGVRLYVAFFFLSCLEKQTTKR
jgi:hypothetical protein